jgi:hypothetical protein
MHKDRQPHIPHQLGVSNAPAPDAPAATSAMGISFFSIVGVFSLGFFRREVEKMMGQERWLQ